WIINPSGDWVWKSTDSKGKLSSKQMAALAQHLATQDFNSLPKLQGYQPQDAESGYHYVEPNTACSPCTYSEPRESGRLQFAHHPPLDLYQPGAVPGRPNG